MHRKIELQAPADITYLYANTVTLSRQKLDLHLPPSATNDTEDAPDPMRERVRELVDEYITKTFTTASNSININGLDDHDHTSLSLNPLTASQSLQAPTETVEYEPYDTALAARVTSLYAQLESLTTTVAQLRRDAPRRAAQMYAEELNKVLEGDEEDGLNDEEGEFGDVGEEVAKKEDGGDVEMDGAGLTTRRRRHVKPEWKIEVPLGSEQESERWHNGEMAEVYDDALRTLLRLQGEDTDIVADAGMDGNALAATVGKAERAERAAEVVEKM